MANREKVSYSNDLDRRVIDWLLEEKQPAVRQNALVDILGRKGNDQGSSTGIEMAVVRRKL